ncbi:hypothetical protein E2C01_102356 [Portunus trituberculatus]|uniref:Uncharacterized protein n=1 Tax=Portunus trituberculatus TaxID=210409 RepID=A0A5B7KCD2_PORTR|nr:hypothetical protein [Portunus trituberculatus]
MRIRRRRLHCRKQMWKGQLYVAGSACFIDLKKEDMEEGPAVKPSAADMEGPAVAGSARFTGLKKEDMEEGPAVCSRVGTFHWFEEKGYGGRASCRTVGSGCGKASCSRVSRCDRDSMSDWLEERVDGGLFGFSCFSSYIS